MKFSARQMNLESSLHQIPQMQKNLQSSIQSFLQSLKKAAGIVARFLLKVSSSVLALSAATLPKERKNFQAAGRCVLPLPRPLCADRTFFSLTNLQTTLILKHATGLKNSFRTFTADSFLFPMTATSLTTQSTKSMNFLEAT